MSRRLSEAAREEFLAQPHIGVLSVSSDGDRPPSASPTWYVYRLGGNIGIITRRDKRKSRLMRRAGKVSLSVQQTEVPYRYVTVEGTVVRQEPATADELAGVGRRYLPADQIDSWIARELGGENPAGEPEYVEIRPDRWFTKDFS